MASTIIKMRDGSELDIADCQLAALGRRSIRRAMDNEQLLEAVEYAADERMLWGALKEACAMEVRRRILRGKDTDGIIRNEVLLDLQDILGDVLRDTVTR